MFKIEIRVGKQKQIYDAKNDYELADKILEELKQGVPLENIHIIGEEE